MAANSSYQPLESENETLELEDAASRVPNGMHAGFPSNGFIPSHTSRTHSRSRSSTASSIVNALLAESGPGKTYPGHIPTELLTVEERKRLWWREATINGFFIASWFLFATILSLYNKWMFSPQNYGFPAPLFVTSMHMFVQWSLAALLRYYAPASLNLRPSTSPTVEEYGQKAIPCAVATGLDIGLSNLSLKTITLSFYTMCKSSSLVFVLGFAFLFHLETFSWRLVGVILFITAGVILMVASETAFVLSGALLVLSASAFGGLRWALTQILLRKKDMGMDNPAATVFWLAPSMGVSLALLSIVVEGWYNIFGSRFFNGLWTSLSTLGTIFAPGAVAFLMVMSEFYIIQRAGMVPMSVAGIFKEVTTISLSAWVFGDELTPINIVGVGITFIGIGLFTFHKYQKSVHSPVPLDGHGNPIVTEGTQRVGLSTMNASSAMAEGDDDDERVRLRSDLEDGSGEDRWRIAGDSDDEAETTTAKVHPVR